MDLKEIGAFFKEVGEIPEYRKVGAARLLFGIISLSSEPDRISRLIMSDRDFDEIFPELTEILIKDGSLLEKDLILKRLNDERDLIGKMHRTFVLKREVGKLSDPLGAVSGIYGKTADPTIWTFLMMSILTARPDVFGR